MKIHCKSGAVTSHAPTRRPTGPITALLLPTLLLLGGTVACLDTVDPPESLAWEGQLQPVIDDGAEPNDVVLVTGSVGAITTGEVTQIGVGIDEGPAEVQLGWVFRRGSCENPDDPIAPVEVFPPIDTDDMGQGELTVETSQRLSRNQTYAAQIYSEPEAQGDLLACADLERVNLGGGGTGSSIVLP